MQKSLDDSKNDAKELNDMIRSANIGLKESSVGKIAVLVFACNRAKTIEKHLNLLFERRNNSNKNDKFPIIVSQDCAHQETAQAIQMHSQKLFAFLKVFQTSFKQKQTNL